MTWLSFVVRLCRWAVVTMMLPGLAFAEPEGPVSADPREEPTTQEASGAKVVPSMDRAYFIRLEDSHGVPMRPSVLRRVVSDAAGLKAGFIVLEVDLPPNPPTEDTTYEDALERAFDRSEDLSFALREGLKRWEPSPRVVAWVKSSSSYATFFVLGIPEIYMHSSGSIGGLGSDMEIIYKHLAAKPLPPGSRALVLRFGFAEVRAADVKRSMLLVRAIYRPDPVCYTLEQGEPRYFEGFPDAPNKVLLSEKYLALDAALAERLGVSKGTAETQEALLMALDRSGSLRSAAGRSAEIIREWSAGADRAITTVEQNVGTLNSSTESGREADRARLALVEGSLELIREFRDAFSAHRWASVEKQLKELRIALRRQVGSDDK